MYYDNLLKKIGELDGVKKDVINKVAKLIEDVERLEEQTKVLTQENTQLEEQVANLTQENVQLKEQVNNEIVEKLTQENTQLKVQAEELEGQMEDIAQRLQDIIDGFSQI